MAGGQREGARPAGICGFRVYGKTLTRLQRKQGSREWEVRLDVKMELSIVLADSI